MYTEGGANVHGGLMYTEGGANVHGGLMPILHRNPEASLGFVVNCFRFIINSIFNVSLVMTSHEVFLRKAHEF